MNRMFVLTIFTLLVPLSAFSGVKVESIQLKLKGPTGTVVIATHGHLKELPDLKIIEDTIKVTLPGADSFPTIHRNDRGAELSAKSVKGMGVVKTILPYRINPDKVILNLNKNNIEVSFPRAKVFASKNEITSSDQSPKVDSSPNQKNKIVSPSKTSIEKDVLNEGYLNKLMREEKNNFKKSLVENKKDKVSVKLSSNSKQPQNIVPKSANDKFSFAGYIVKFSIFLALVLCLFYGIVHLLKRGTFKRGKIGFLNNSQMIQVLSTTYIAPKKSLMVVKVHNQIFLLSSSEDGIRFVSEIEDPNGVVKETEKHITGTNFDVKLEEAERKPDMNNFKLKEDINESRPSPEVKGIQGLSTKEIVRFSDELKKKAKKLKRIEFN